MTRHPRRARPTPPPLTTTHSPLTHSLTRASGPTGPGGSPTPPPRVSPPAPPRPSSLATLTASLAACQRPRRLHPRALPELPYAARRREAIVRRRDDVAPLAGARRRRRVGRAGRAVRSVEEERVPLAALGTRPRGPRARSARQPSRARRLRAEAAPRARPRRGAGDFLAREGYSRRRLVVDAAPRSAGAARARRTRPSAALPVSSGASSPASAGVPAAFRGVVEEVPRPRRESVPSRPVVDESISARRGTRRRRTRFHRPIVSAHLPPRERKMTLSSSSLLLVLDIPPSSSSSSSTSGATGAPSTPSLSRMAYLAC